MIASVGVGVNFSVAAEADAAPHGPISLALLLGQEEHDVPAVVEVAKVVVTTTVARQTGAHVSNC